MSTLTLSVAGAMLADRLSAASRSREARTARRTTQPAPVEPVVLRRAVPQDEWALKGLAALDSAPTPTGDVLVAEVGGQVTAALPLDGGQPIADPFKRTAGLVEMLRLRAAA